MTRLTVNVIGCGEIAQIMHLPHLVRMSDRFEVRAVCDRDPDVLAGVARRFGVDATYTDHREMLASSPADVVAILPSGDHAGMVLDALDHGAHVFVEKPLCYHPDDARRIAARAEETGKTVMVGYSRLFDSAFRQLQEALEKETGPVYLRAEAALPMDYYYRAHHDVVRPRDWTPPDAAPWWGGSWEYFRDELLCNLAIHEIYCLRVLSGLDRPGTIVAADVLDRRGVEASWQGAGRVHASMGVLTMDTIAGGYVEEFRAVTGSTTHVLSYPSIYLVGQPASLTTSGLRDGSLATETRLGSYEEPFLAELEHFHEVVVDGRPCLSPAAEAVHDVDVLDRIDRAARAARSASSATERTDEPAGARS